MSMTDYLEGKLLGTISTGTAYSAPYTYVGLFTTAPTDVAGSGVEVATTDANNNPTAYSRVRVNQDGTSPPYWVSGTGGPEGASIISNSGAITFPTATADWGEVVAVGVFDGSDASANLLFWEFLGVTQFDYFTVDATTNTFTSYGIGNFLSNNARIVLRGDQLPAEVTADTLYYAVNVTTDSFQVSTAAGGTAIDVLSGGEGIVLKVTPQVVNSGGTLKFDDSNLVFGLT